MTSDTVRATVKEGEAPTLVDGLGITLEFTLPASFVKETRPSGDRYCYGGLNAWSKLVQWRGLSICLYTDYLTQNGRTKDGPLQLLVNILSHVSTTKALGAWPISGGIWTNETAPFLLSTEECYQKDADGTVGATYNTGKSLTLAQCQQKCRDGTWASCAGFSRYSSVADSDVGACWWVTSSSSLVDDDPNNDEHMYRKTACSVSEVVGKPVKVHIGSGHSDTEVFFNDQLVSRFHWHSGFSPILAAKQGPAPGGGADAVVPGETNTETNPEPPTRSSTHSLCRRLLSHCTLASLLFGDCRLELCP
jgi:hypothetical protein